MTKDKNLVRVGVASWILNPNGAVLIGRRVGSHGAGTWAPPGGHMEFGESPKETAIRETAEETGLILPPSDVKIVGITNDIFDSENKHYVTIHCVTLFNLFTSVQVMEPNRCTEWWWAYPTRMPDNMFPPAAKFIKFLIERTK